MNYNNYYATAQVLQLYQSVVTVTSSYQLP